MSDTPHPGLYVQAWLRENHKNQAYLASAMQFQEPFISKIVHGHAHVSPKIALKLEAVTRVPATAWMRYETDYRLARERQRANLIFAPGVSSAGNSRCRRTSMLTKTLRFDDDVVVVLRNQVCWSPDGLRAEMPQLNPKLYQKVKKAFEALGGKWSRKDGATIFTVDPRTQVEGLITRGCLTVARDGFFPTPETVLWKMMAYAPLGDCGYNTMEPSCGEGAIVEFLLKRGIQRERLYCIEQNPKRCQYVRESWKGVRVACGDFLKFRNSAHIPFHRIFMNPPFEQGQDADHVQKAYGLLSENGILVSVMGEGIFYRDDSKAANFRSWLNQVGGYSEKLPEKSFHASGTDVATRLVVLEK